MQAPTEKKRIEWIDALRGFTMILVVLSHVECWGLKMEYGYAGVNDLLRIFRMPLFFFVSGFIAFRANEEWNWSHYKGNLLKKMTIQIIPMLFFGLLFTFLVYFPKYEPTPEHPLFAFFNDLDKHGYWFTEALLGMFVIYYTVSFLLRKCSLVVRQGVLVAIALAFYALAFRSITGYANIPIANWLCLYKIFLFFQFFVFGNLVSCYRDKVFKALGNSYVSAAVLLLFAGLYIFYYFRHDVQSVYVVTPLSKLTAEAIRYLGVITMVMIFRHFEHTFSQTTRIGRGLQYIGRRTLDIYLLHFFLIPTLPMVGAFLTSTPNMLLELVTVISLSLLVIAFCLIISNIIRISPFLAYWLFGVKKKQNN